MRLTLDTRGKKLAWTLLSGLDEVGSGEAKYFDFGEDIEYIPTGTYLSFVDDVNGRWLLESFNEHPLTSVTVLYNGIKPSILSAEEFMIGHIC